MKPQFLKSLSHAWAGIKIFAAEDANMRIHWGAAIAALAGALLFRFSPVEFSIVILCIALVIALEGMNSVLERLIDAVKPRVAHEVRILKDCMAAMVLLASGAAAAIGIVIYGSHLIAALAMQ